MPANPNNQDPKGVPEQTLAPHEICPEGTKVWMLCLGWLEADDAFLVRGANISLKSTEGESFVNKRRKLPMYCVLIEHPTAGLILWETGGDKVGKVFATDCERERLTILPSTFPPQDWPRTVSADSMFQAPGDS